ncbi:MAG: chloride channel protein [Cyclobacteriaceae bacterium]|nr:MAG: chloride channel protein [Cyclobacteriaceae bacterium]
MNEWAQKHSLLLSWIQQKLSERQFFILSSVLVGLTAGLAAVLLKSLVHLIYELVTHDYQLPFQFWLYLFLPFIGLLITVLYAQRFHKGSFDKGTSFILYAITRKSSLMAPFHMVAHLITSAITIGFGGSSGLEAPIATTGSAIGSNYARTYHLNYRQRTLLLSCGAAAGIAAAFNAPIAGVLFAIEILLLDISATAFIPLIIASAVGALCSNIILQDGILLSFKTQIPFNFYNVPYYVLMGIFAGLLATYHSRTFLQVDAWFAKRKSPYVKVFIGGGILAVLILLFPPLFGEGYSSVIALSQNSTQTLLNASILKDFITNEWLILLFIGGIMLAKTFAVGATISSGGNGGNFAPSLMTGAFLGFFFSRFINLTGFGKLPESNFTLVAMAGVMSGVMHAPLTAIFLIAEVTGGYGLMIPLMIVASISYTVSRFIEPESIESKKLAQKGAVIIHDRDKKILSDLSLSNLIETNFQSIVETARLRDLIAVIEKTTRNIFPVITEEGKLTGVIELNSIREIMFNTELYDKIVVKELMRKAPAIIEEGESMDEVMKKFDATDSWNLPVTRQGKYLGFISKSAIFNKYRSELIEKSVH